MTFSILNIMIEINDFNRKSNDTISIETMTDIILTETNLILSSM